MDLFGWLDGRRTRKQRRAARRTPAHGGRRLRLEPLEQRQVLSVTLSPIVGPDANGAFNVPAGKDLYVPLTGVDVGKTVSYSAQSSDPNVHVSVFTGNPTLVLNVTGTDSSNQAFTGTMTVQLFPNLAPNTVAKIEGLVNSGFYNGLTFYRIATGFVIQGGANGTKIAPSFNDEFNAAVTFNSPGMLAMTNPGTPNSNRSDIFISDIGLPLTSTPQSLNFRHTVFGQLTSGFAIYSDIMNAKGITSTNESPTIPVTITSASIITDTQNGVVQISEPNNFTGSASINVTANATDGTTTQRSFNVAIAPTAAATAKRPLFLTPVSDQTTPINTAIQFQLSATESAQIAADPFALSVTGTTGFTGAPANVTVQVTPNSATTAMVTLTPATDFTGTINLLAHVDVNTSSANGGPFHDALPFTLTVNARPQISTIGDQTVPSNTAAGPIGITLTDTSVPVGNLTLSGSSSNTTLVPNANIIYGGSGANRTVTVTPASGQTGSAIITTNVSDGAGGTNSTTFKLTVNPSQNGVPNLSGFVFIDPADSGVRASGAMGVPHVTITLSGTDSSNSAVNRTTTTGMDGSYQFTDVPGGTYDLKATQPAMLSASKAAAGSLGGTVGTNEISQIVLPAGGSGTDYNFGERGLTSHVVTTNGINLFLASTPPLATILAGPTISTITDQTISGNKSTSALSFTVHAPLVPAASLTVSGSSSNTTLVPNANIVYGGSVANRTVKVTPASGQTGTATITTTVSDGNGGTASSSFILTVNPPTTISTIANQTTTANTATSAIPFTVGGSTVPAANLTLSGTSSNTALVPNANIVFGGSGANRTVTLTPASNQSGTSTITATVDDGLGGAVSSTFTLTVSSQPAISSIADQTTKLNTATAAIPFTLTDNSAPVAGLTVSGASSNLALVPVANIIYGGSGANRTVKVTPAAGQTGTATITTNVSDGFGGTTSNSFMLTVQ